MSQIFRGKRGNIALTRKLHLLGVLILSSLPNIYIEANQLNMTCCENKLVERHQKSAKSKPLPLANSAYE